ncbi:MAG: mercuric transporter MerT family protein, partial [Gemmatimonadaceae bacterium]
VRARLFSVTAVLGALGAGFCCLGPVIFSILGVSAMASLTTLRNVVPYRNAFFAVTVAALGLAFWNVIARRGRVARAEWAVLGGSTVAVAALSLYSISIEGLPRLW